MGVLLPSFYRISKSLLACVSSHYELLVTLLLEQPNIFCILAS